MSAPSAPLEPSVAQGSPSNPGLVRLYGAVAMEFHAGKSIYRASNGVLDVPAHLVQQAQRAGFTRTPSALVDTPLPLPSAPSNQLLGLPAEHPQQQIDAELREREAVAATAAAAEREKVPASGVTGGGKVKTAAKA